MRISPSLMRVWCSVSLFAYIHLINLNALISICTSHLMFLSTVFGFLNWRFYQGNGLDVVTGTSGFYKFKCDDQRIPILPNISTTRTTEYTEITISSTGTKTFIEIPSPSDDYIFGMGQTIHVLEFERKNDKKCAT